MNVERGRVDRVLRVTDLGAARGSGFPRLAFLPDGTALVAWTDIAEDDRRLRVRRVMVQ